MCCTPEGQRLAKYKLKAFQREDVNKIKKANLRALVASAPGTGKTCVALSSVLETGKWSLPCLIVCPSSVTRNWAKEIKLWAPGLRSHIIEDTNGKIPSDMEVYIISWALLDPRCMELLGMEFRSIVGDECHLIKNPDAIRSQAFYKISRGKNMGILLLSGTPLVNRPEEMGVLQALFEKTPLLIRRLLEDVAPEVPKKKRSYLYIKLRDRAQAEYERAVSDFEQWLRKKKEELLGEGMAESAVERALSAEAFVKFGYLRRLLAESKVPAAVDWVSRAVRVGEPVVVFLEHGEPLARFSEGLREQRIRHEIIEGATPPKKRQRYVDEFQANKFPVIICTDAGAEGITLHAARHLLIVERSLTSAKEEQKEDRIRRLGQRFPTTIWFLHATGTLDDRLDVIIKTKRVIIRDAIGSEDTAESEAATVESLVRNWGQLVNTKARKITELGRTDPLPPLPSPGGAHAILFSGERWKAQSAARWCRMNGYMPTGSFDMDTRFKLIINPADLFKPNQFTAFKVCSDVKVIVGKRLSASNEAIVRRKMLINAGKEHEPKKDS